MSDRALEWVRCACRFHAVWAAVVLAATVAVVHGDALEGGWRFDDHYQLIVSQRLGVLASLSDPNAWRQFSPLHYTPWLAWMYRLDTWAFGLEPRWHYAHLLVSLLAVGWLTYRLLQPVSGSVWALMAAVGTVADAPALVAARYLPGRHYADGLVFTLLAVLCQRRWVSGHGPHWLAASALAGLGALLNKEIFLPLCAVLPLLGDLPWRRRLLAGALHGSVALGFIIWRSRMIGELVGGYGHTLSPNVSLLTLPLRFPLALTGNDVFGMTATLLFFSVLGAWLWRKQALLPAALVISAGLVAPFLALPEDGVVVPPEDLAGMRLYLAPGWTCWVGLALAAPSWQRAGGVPRLFAATASVVFALAALAFSRNYLTSLDHTLAQYDRQNEFIASHGPGDTLVSVGHFPFWGADAREAQIVLYRREPARLVTGWHDFPSDAGPFWRYDESCRCVRELPREAVLAMPEFQPPPIKPLAFRVSMRMADPIVFVELGPDDHGARFFRSGQGWPIDATPAGLRFDVRPPDNVFPLRFLRQVGADTALSAPINLPPAGTPLLEWQKGIFTEPGLLGTPAFPPTLPAGGRCALAKITGTDGGPATAILANTPVTLNGTASAPDGSHPFAIMAALLQGERIRFVAPVYRLTSHGAVVPTEDVPSAEFGITDADFSAVRSGHYELSILQSTPEGARLCDLHWALTVSPPET